jgi:hypothetical protein
VQQESGSLQKRIAAKVLLLYRTTTRYIHIHICFCFFICGCFGVVVAVADWEVCADFSILFLKWGRRRSMPEESHRSAIFVVHLWGFVLQKSVLRS